VLFGLGVPQHGIVVCLLEQLQVVVDAVLLQASFQVLRVPLLVFSGRKALNSLADVVVLAAQENIGVRVDVLLELGRVLLRKLLRVTLFLFALLVGHLIAFFVELLWLGCRLLRRDEKHFERGRIAHGVAVEDVAPVLTVVLTESPSEGLAQHLHWNLFNFGILLVVLVDLELQSERLELILRVKLLCLQLGELLFVFVLPFVDLSALGFGLSLDGLLLRFRLFRLLLLLLCLTAKFLLSLPLCLL